MIPTTRNFWVMAPRAKETALNDRTIAKPPIAIRIREMKDSTSPSDNAAKNTAARQAKEKRSMVIM